MSSCSPILALLHVVRTGMCLSFLLYAVVLGYLIAMQFRSDLLITPVGLTLIVSGKFIFAVNQPGLRCTCLKVD